MKIKIKSNAKFFLVLTAIAYFVATFGFCYKTKPAVSKGEFPFSVTYEYKGERKKLSGVYECEYSGSITIHGEHNRYWEGEVKYENPENVENPNIVEQNDEMQTSLAIQENMHAGYFMGDPLYQGHYKTYGLEGPYPHIEYYDYKNEISLDEKNKDEILESIGFKIIECSYPEPIKNSFSFSGIQYDADNIFIFVAILVVYFLLCLIFVRKDKEYKYTKLDKFGIAMNFLVGIFAVPFITVTCFFFGLAPSNVEPVNQLMYNIPPIAILCLALSIVLRRKGYSKTGFFIQFSGVVLYLLSILLDIVLYYN